MALTSHRTKPIRNTPKKPQTASDFFPNTETARTWRSTVDIRKFVLFSKILPFLSFFIEDCHAINYYFLFAFSCDLHDSCHCHALNQKQREREAVRLYELTPSIEFHEVGSSLAKTVNHIKYQLKKGRNCKPQS